MVQIASRRIRQSVDHNFVYRVTAGTLRNSREIIVAQHRTCLRPLITQTTPSASADPVVIWSRKLIESSDQCTL